MTLDILSNLIIQNWHIILLFFMVAILYSSVGFGGGSSYLAILALTGIAFTQIRSTALLCNIIVVLGNVFYFQRKKLYYWKKVTPLVIFSVPLAFLGGYLKISETFFFILLGITLLFASITMWNSKRFVSKSNVSKKNGMIRNGGIGGLIGFISGLVGIGGGIFLAPILHLTQWDTPKKIAATASIFILVNSTSGLIGQYLNPNFSIDWNLTIILLISVFIGGILGNKLRGIYFSPIQLKKATAFLIAIVALRILLNHFFKY